jgi:hypothetical protein
VTSLFAGGTPHVTARPKTLSRQKEKGEDAASHTAINLSVLGAFDKHRHELFDSHVNRRNLEKNAAVHRKWEAWIAPVVSIYFM